MILAVCTDDLKNTFQVGQQALAEHRDVFLSCYRVFSETPVPQLGVNESLFVIAHGASNVGGKPMIGDQRDAMVLDAATFWENLKEIIPPEYESDIYVIACQSADPAPSDDFSFAEYLAALVKIDRSVNCRVFGRKGNIPAVVPLPTDSIWTLAVVG